MEFSGGCCLYGLTFQSLLYLSMASKRKRPGPRSGEPSLGPSPATVQLCATLDSFLFLELSLPV